MAASTGFSSSNGLRCQPSRLCVRSKSYNCSRPSYELNYPSFVAFYADKSLKVETKFQRIVTYVGDGPARRTMALQFDFQVSDGEGLWCGFWLLGVPLWWYLGTLSSTSKLGFNLFTFFYSNNYITISLVIFLYWKEYHCLSLLSCYACSNHPKRPYNTIFRQLYMWSKLLNIFHIYTKSVWFGRTRSRSWATINKSNSLCRWGCFKISWSWSRRAANNLKQVFHTRQHFKFRMCNCWEQHCQHGVKKSCHSCQAYTERFHETYYEYDSPMDLVLFHEQSSET